MKKDTNYWKFGTIALSFLFCVSILVQIENRDPKKVVSSTDRDALSDRYKVANESCCSNEASESDENDLEDDEIVTKTDSSDLPDLEGLEIDSDILEDQPIDESLPTQLAPLKFQNVPQQETRKMTEEEIDGLLYGNKTLSPTVTDNQGAIDSPQINGLDSSIPKVRGREATPEFVVPRIITQDTRAPRVTGNYANLDSVYVRGYTRRDGTYVKPHRRSNADGVKYNNWSTKGNINPYTGKRGTKKP